MLLGDYQKKLSYLHETMWLFTREWIIDLGISLIRAL